MDYEARRRVKIWGRARVVEDDPALLARLAASASSRGRPERVIVFQVEAWDVNCPQHIPQKLDVARVAEALDVLERRVRELEAENERLRASARESDER
jgi:predicted pyridoxine 5'-phosphate oxidase superfamily flavin-nucleotide-binding protein